MSIFATNHSDEMLDVYVSKVESYINTLKRGLRSITYNKIAEFLLKSLIFVIWAIVLACFNVFLAITIISIIALASIVVLVLAIGLGSIAVASVVSFKTLIFVLYYIPKYIWRFIQTESAVRVLYAAIQVIIVVAVLASIPVYMDWNRGYVYLFVFLGLALSSPSTSLDWIFPVSLDDSLRKAYPITFWLFKAMKFTLFLGRVLRALIANQLPHRPFFGRWGFSYKIHLYVV